MKDYGYNILVLAAKEEKKIKEKIEKLQSQKDGKL